MFIRRDDNLRAPRFTQRQLIVSIWCVVMTVSFVLASVDGIDPSQFVVPCLTCICGCTLSIALFALIRWLRRHVASRTSLLVTILLLPVAGTALWLCNILTQAWVSGHTPVGGWPGDLFQDIRLSMSWRFYTLLFVLQAVIFALLDSFETLQARERQLVEARLTALRFQLNPHFLFNTLNAISTLVAEAGVTKAEEMIARLSDFLRTALSEDATDLVLLEYELEMVQAYLAIESERFEDRLSVHYACGTGLGDVQVPSLILQPLVENAIKYAVAPSKERVNLWIRARANGDDLVLAVEDDGLHSSTASAGTGTGTGTGVGLRNVAARLETLYGSAGRITPTRRERGFSNVIRLPLRRARQ